MLVAGTRNFGRDLKRGEVISGELENVQAVTNHHSQAITNYHALCAAAITQLPYQQAVEVFEEFVREKFITANSSKTEGNNNNTSNTSKANTNNNEANSPSHNKEANTTVENPTPTIHNINSEAFCMSYGATISTCIRNKDYGRAMYYFEDLEKAGITPGVKILSSMITCFGRFSGTNNTNIGGRGSGNGTDAMELLRHAEKEFGIEPDIIMYNAVLDVCAKTACARPEEGDIALEVLREVKRLSLKQKKVYPTLVTYNSTISACANAIQGVVTRQSVRGVITRTECLNNNINDNSNINNINNTTDINRWATQALKVFSELDSNLDGDNSNTKDITRLDQNRDPVTINALLKALSYAGWWDAVFGLLGSEFPASKLVGNERISGSKTSSSSKIKTRDVRTTWDAITTWDELDVVGFSTLFSANIAIEKSEKSAKAHQVAIEKSGIDKSGIDGSNQSPTPNLATPNQFAIRFAAIELQKRLNAIPEYEYNLLSGKPVLCLPKLQPPKRKAVDGITSDNDVGNNNNNNNINNINTSFSCSIVSRISYCEHEIILIRIRIQTNIIPNSHSNKYYYCSQ